MSPSGSAGTLKDQVRKVRDAVNSQIEKLKYRDAYTKPHQNLDINLHIREAAAWLCRAQDAPPDRGFSYGAMLDGDFLPSYPETTGYIIPTFLNLATYFKDPSYRQRAIEAGDWEIAVQMPEGAVMGGRIGQKQEPAMFNTGQVLLGWSALYEDTKQERFRIAGNRAADWMISMQEPNGNWIRGNSTYSNALTTVYNVKAAWGLAEMGRVTGNQSYIDAALHNANYAVSKQLPNGWFADCCLDNATLPLLHTIAYTMQGLVGIYKIARKDHLLAAARKTADTLISKMQDDGYLPGRYDSSFNPAVAWSCVTGSAQTAWVWEELFLISGDPKYRDAAFKANRWLLAHHDISSANPAVKGGVSGAYPVSGDYGQYMVLNWAAKFFVDSLLLQKQIETK